MINKGIILGVLTLAIIGATGYGIGSYAAQAATSRNGAGAQVRQGAGDGQCNGGSQGGCGMRSGERGQNKGGNFVDANNDGICDHMQ